MSSPRAKTIQHDLETRAGTARSALSGQGRHRGVILLVLATACVLGLGVSVGAGHVLGQPVLLVVAVSLGIAAGMLVGVALARFTLSTPALASTDGDERHVAPVSRPLRRLGRRIAAVATLVALGGLLALAQVAWSGWAVQPLPALVACIAASLSLVAAWLAGVAGRYLEDAHAVWLPEGGSLARGARVLAAVFVAAAVALVLAWAGWSGGVRAIDVSLLALNAAVCAELLIAGATTGAEGCSFPVDLRALAILGSRTNPLASALDAAQRQLGIDLRSTWALTLVRRSVEPIAVGLALLWWLSTALSVVGVEEQALVERLGVLQDGPTMGPGLHLHWPWPIDEVVQIPVRRIQNVSVGHEGEEESGPEDVLWARRHGTTEYTLLLGNGRDLIAVDAGLQFRITDPAAWHYHCVNPLEVLRAIGYRAVMTSTVGRTLAETLSENVATLTEGMTARAQADADALGLGVQVVAFTVGGMHPPVNVADAYQAVVSAELARTTSAIEAEAYRNGTVPAAQAEVVASANAARAEAAQLHGVAAGEAWSFLALQAQASRAPDDFHFRRRLESLEQALRGRTYTVLDARVQREGGELWLMK